MTMSIKSIIDTDKRKGDTAMSEKEMALRLLDNVPSYKLGYVIAYLQGITAYDAADEAFCERLCEEYDQDTDKGQFISMEEMAKMSGVSLDAI